LTPLTLGQKAQLYRDSLNVVVFSVGT
jgi:hypothetical protein